MLQMNSLFEKHQMFRDRKYKLTINEQNLIKSSHNVAKLQVMQQNSYTKLQYKAYNKTVWIRSALDDYKMFRMLMLGLLIKIFSKQNDLNEMRLEKLKEIIYSAQLQGLTQGKCIEKQLLFKNIALSLDSLNKSNKSLSQTETAVVSLFNNVPFFDDTIMLSLAQKFQIDFLDTTIEAIQHWLRENLSLSIIWTAQSPYDENDNQIFLRSKAQSLMRRSVNTQMEVMSEQTESVKQNISSKSPANTRIKILKTISIQSASAYPSPNLNLSTNEKQSQKSQKHSVSRFGSDSRHPKAKGSRLWNIFCCRFD